MFSTAMFLQFCIFKVFYCDFSGKEELNAWYQCDQTLKEEASFAQEHERWSQCFKWDRRKQKFSV